jgi:hypothetical protein
VTCTPSEVTKTISTGNPAGKVSELELPQVKVTVAELLGGIAAVVVAVLLEGVIVIEPVEHIRVPFVNSSSAVAMETVGLAGGL